MYRRRLQGAALPLLGAALVWIGSASSQPLPPPVTQSLLACDPPPGPAVTPWSWDEDSAREVIISDDASKVRIVADELNVDAESLPSLVRSRNSAIPNIHDLEIDAREVVIRGPLSFQSARIHIRAEHLTFKPGGYLALTGEPPPSGDGVRIEATKMDLQGGGYPFLLATRPGTRSVNITALALTDDGQEVTQQNAAERLRSRSMDEHLGRPVADWTVRVGSEATADLAAARSLASWPLATAAKAVKHHARVGYDPGQRARLTQVLKDLRPSLEGTSHPEAILQVDDTLRRLAEAVDSSGYLRDQMPRDSFNTQLDTVKKLVTNLSELEPLEALIVATHRAHAPDQERLAALRTDQDKDEARAAQASRDADAALKSLLAAQTDVGVAADHVEQRRQRLQRDLEELKQQDQAAYERQSEGKVFVFAGGLLAMTGPVGAGVGVGLGILGRIYAGDDPPKTPDDVINTLADIQAEVQTYRDAASAVTAAWGRTDETFQAAKALLAGQAVAAAPADGKPGPTDGRPVSTCVSQDTSAPSRSLAVCGAVEFGKSAKAFADAAGKLHGMLFAPNSTTEVRNMSGMEREDGELGTLLHDLATEQDKLASAQAAFDAAAKTAVEARSDALSILSTMQSLFTTTVVDDEQAARWSATATMLRRNRLDALYAEAVRLRRAFTYANGIAPKGSADILYFPDESAGAANVGFGQPTDGFAKSSEQLAARLLDERTRVKAAVDGLAEGLKDQMKAYDRRYSAGSHAHTIPAEFNAGSTTEATRAFLARINDELRTQNAELAAGRQIRSPTWIPVPTNIFGRPMLENLPEQLAGAAVDRVEYVDSQAMAGKSLGFDLIHPGYGYVQTASSACMAFDLRTDGGSEFVYVSTMQPPGSDGVAQGNGGDLTDPRWVKPPLRAPYSLRVFLQGADPGRPGFGVPPVIKDLRIHFSTQAE